MATLSLTPDQSALGPLARYFPCPLPAPRAARASGVTPARRRSQPNVSSHAAPHLPDLPPAAVKEELALLNELAGVDLRPEVFDVLVELTRLDVVPTATAQVLKSLAVKKAMRASVGGAAGVGR